MWEAVKSLEDHTYIKVKSFKFNIYLNTSVHKEMKQKLKYTLKKSNNVLWQQDHTVEVNLVC